MLLPKIAPRQGALPHPSSGLDVNSSALLLTPHGRRSKGWSSPGRASAEQSVNLGGAPVNLMDFERAVELIMDRAQSGGAKPLGVCSANLDHLRHFGSGSRWHGTLDQPTPVEWLTLLDGAPLVAEAARVTGHAWPRLAGSDVVEPLLDEAERRGLRVGFLGGSPQAQELIRKRFARERSGLTVAGWWAPERPVLADVNASRLLAADIADAGVDVLVVGLGKPRQELWICEYGQLTGAKVLLAFGAVVDFLAGRIRRAPVWVSTHGLEWGWRLMLEPRRLARRYLVDGPGAYLTLRMSSSSTVQPAPVAPAAGVLSPAVSSTPEDGPSRAPGQFVPAGARADVAVLVVTYNNAEDVTALVASLREETAEQSLKVVVADNSPDERTMAELLRHPDIIPVRTGGNLGYAGGINAAMRVAGDADAYLILNPDLRVETGAVAALRRRMALSGAGMVVPVLLDDDGSVYPSLRREPSVLRALGDAALGSRVKGRPGWLSEMDFDPESYLHAHRVDWATGAALLISADTARDVGGWDEQFFLYSEETDYCRRVRDSGRSIWCEPLARMWHERGGSGTSPQLNALMSVNRVRYAEKYCGPVRVTAFRAVVLVSELARLHKPGHREAAVAVVDRRRWKGLPHASLGGRSPAQMSPAQGVAPPSGAVIIPAHNEASVIARTLQSLEGVIAWGTVEVIVACNGCTDGTEAVASGFHGVRVLQVEAASKAAALNAADQVVERWPRLYLDADIEVTTEAVHAVLTSLGDGPLLAARPAFRYDTEGASVLVRSYYRARARIPSNAQGLWGAGAYALGRAGHDRLGGFPILTGDDYYVDRLFSGVEKAVLPTGPVVVRTPRTRSALLAVLRRSYRGNAEQDGQEAGATTSRTVRELLASVRGPLSAVDAVVYVAFAVVGRRRPLLGRSVATGWERDDSSR